MPAPIQISNSIELTDYKTGEAFYLSANQIIYFTRDASDGTQIVYTDNRDNIITRLVTEFYETVNARAPRTFGVTLADTEKTVFIDADKIIFLDINRDLGTFTITYDSKKEYPDSLVISFLGDFPPLGNLFEVTVAATGATRYLNNLFVNAITANIAGSEIMYDSKGTENSSIIVQESALDVSNAINALADGGLTPRAPLERLS
jgi:hypothetical protein